MDKQFYVENPLFFYTAACRLSSVQNFRPDSHKKAGILSLDHRAEITESAHRHERGGQGTAVTGSDERSFKACCEIQGLPAGFDIPPFFSLSGKKQAVANGVPMALGRYVAGLIAET